MSYFSKSKVGNIIYKQQCDQHDFFLFLNLRNQLFLEYIYIKTFYKKIQFYQLFKKRIIHVYVKTSQMYNETYNHN